MITGFLLAYAIITMPLIGLAVRSAYKKKEVDIYTPRAIFNVIVETGRVSEEWFKSMRRAQDDAKADHQAMLRATKAIAQSMLEIKGTAESFSAKARPEKGVKQFVHDLEYVRDNYANTKGQKGAVEGIINLLNKKHGADVK